MKTVSATLAFILLFAALCGVSSASGRPEGKSAEEMIDEYVLSQMKEGQIPGLALGIAENGEITYMKGYGKANDGGGPVTPQTPFTTGSVGKTFTALAIRQLVNAGKLDYEAPVRRYIPWFTLKDPEAAGKIRIIDLIRHQSGLSTASGVEPAAYAAGLTLEQAVRRLKGVAQDRPAGGSEEYCNLNYIILGYVVETVSGMSYAEYIRQNIFEPLGMKHSYPTFLEARQAEPSTARGHYVAYGLTVPNNEPLPGGQVPAGFQAASAEDLTRFAMLYLNNGYYQGESIIPGNALPERTAGSPFRQEEQRYGTYFVEETGQPQGYLGYYGHAGATSGFTTVMLINPQADCTIVVLANCRNDNLYPGITAQTIGNGIASIFNSGILPSPVPQSRPGLLINLAVAAAILALLVLRAVWARRFRRSVSKGGARKALALGSFALLDVLVPIVALLVLPLYYGNSWAYFLNSNMEMNWLIFVSALILAGIGAVKVLILALGRRKIGPLAVDG